MKPETAEIWNYARERGSAFVGWSIARSTNILDLLIAARGKPRPFRRHQTCGANTDTCGSIAAVVSCIFAIISREFPYFYDKTKGTRIQNDCLRYEKHVFRCWQWYISIENSSKYMKVSQTEFFYMTTKTTFLGAVSPLKLISAYLDRGVLI